MLPNICLFDFIIFDFVFMSDMFVYKYGVRESFGICINEKTFISHQIIHTPTRNSTRQPIKVI